MKIYRIAASLLLITLVGCAHQNDDDRPMRSITSPKPELVSPPLPPPPPSVSVVPENGTVGQAPLVTIPAPLATGRQPNGKPSAPVAAMPTQPLPAAAGSLQLSEPLAAPVRRMMSQADEALKKGKVLEARALADRAYRMNLRDPRTSFLMARVSQREKAYEDAEQWAFRSLENLSDAANKRVVWSFIAQCRDKNGNKKGSQAAIKTLNDLKR